MYATRIPILMYHRIGEPDFSRDIYCVHPDRFTAQMRALARAGFRPVSIEDFDAWHRGSQNLPRGAFVLTFDDGFAGIHKYALPVLNALGWTATVFVVAGKIGEKSNWKVTISEPMTPHSLMDAPQLRNLAMQGFSLHSHSLMHHDLTTISISELEKDLGDSRSIIANITGEMPRFLAYPFGRHNEAVRNAAQRVGFEAAYSVTPGFNKPHENTYQIRRLDVFGYDTPSMLLRKIRLGTNEGGANHLIRYYFNRLLRRN